MRTANHERHDWHSKQRQTYTQGSIDKAAKQDGKGTSRNDQHHIVTEVLIRERLYSVDLNFEGLERLRCK